MNDMEGRSLNGGGEAGMMDMGMGMGGGGMGGGMDRKSMMMNAMANMGRGGDTEMAHVSEGEFIIPQQVLEAYPQMLVHIIKGFQKAGVPDWRRYMVGGPDDSMNPQTGAPEYFFEGDDYGFTSENFGGGTGATTSGPGPGFDGDGGSQIVGSDNVTLGEYPGATSGPGSDLLGMESSPDEQRMAATQAAIADFGTPGVSGAIRSGFDAMAGLVPTGQSPGPLLGIAPMAGNAARQYADARGWTTSDPTFPGLNPNQNDEWIRALSPARQEAVRGVMQRFTRPAEATAPSFLSFPGGMTGQQIRSNLATYGTQGEDPRYRDPETVDYYRNQLLRALISDTGEPGPYGEVLPIEHQFLRQLNYAYDPSTVSLLEALTAA